MFNKIKIKLLFKQDTLLHKSVKQCFSNMIPKSVFTYLSSVNTEQPFSNQNI
jgi:hypothetical protein